MIKLYKIGENIMLHITWKKLSEFAKVPDKKHDDDAGYDLYSPVDRVIDPHGFITIDTNIAAQGALDMNSAKSYLVSAKIEGCSGNAKNKGIGVLGGRWDQGYQGDIGVVLVNNSEERIVIHKGDKIAQMVWQIIPKTTVDKVLDKDTPFVDTTDRGEDGFGSTGGIK